MAADSKKENTADKMPEILLRSAERAGGRGRVKITGVRWAESQRRKENAGLIKVIGKEKTMQKLAGENGVDFKQSRQGGLVMNNDNSETRRFVEMCYRTTATMVNPIVDWTDTDVWEFLKHYGCQSNPLYQRGRKRIGCIGCPMQGGRGMKREFAEYPKYRAAYVRAFDKMLEARAEAGLATNSAWCDGEHVMRWWLGDDPNQITMSDYMDGPGHH